MFTPAPNAASSPPAPNAASSPPAPNAAEEKSSPSRNKRSRIGLFAGGALLGVLAGLALGPLGFLDWMGEWSFSDLEMSVAATPLATILSASGVIVAAGIAFYNGEKNRHEEKERHKQEKEHQEEAAKRETERSLRDRFFKITETLSEGTEYVKREAGVYALIALADDWAAFHGDDPDAAQREQQTCLNVITGQLRDPLNTDSPQAHSDSETAESAQQKKEQPQDDLGLLIFKHRVQEILWERFRPSDGAETGSWSHLDLELSNCHLHNSHSGLAEFHGRVSFDGAQFHGRVSFDGAQFHGRVSFDGAQFHSHAFFIEAQFHSRSSFNDAQFHGRTSFSGAQLHGSIYFNGAQFHSRSSFNETQFRGNIHFLDTEFHSSSSFNETQFRGRVSFDGAEFYVRASFNGAQFYGIASFSWVEFRGSALFNQVHLHSRIDFNQVHFHGRVVFNQVHLHSRIDFNRTYFCSSFKWEKVTQDEGQINFKNVHFRAEKPTVLQELDADTYREIVTNTTFSVECPSDSL